MFGMILDLCKTIRRFSTTISHAERDSRQLWPIISCESVIEITVVGARGSAIQNSDYSSGSAGVDASGEAFIVRIACQFRIAFHSNRWSPRFRSRCMRIEVEA